MFDLLIEFIGYIGMVLGLFAVYLTRKHFLKSQITFIIASFFLGTYAIFSKYPIIQVPTLLLNIIWALINFYNILKFREEHRA